MIFIALKYPHETENGFEKYLKGYCRFKILFASENLVFEPHSCLLVLSAK